MRRVDGRLAPAHVALHRVEDALRELRGVDLRDDVSNARRCACTSCDAPSATNATGAMTAMSSAGAAAPSAARACRAARRFARRGDGHELHRPRHPGPHRDVGGQRRDAGHGHRQEDQLALRVEVVGVGPQGRSSVASDERACRRGRAPRGERASRRARTPARGRLASRRPRAPGGAAATAARRRASRRARRRCSPASPRAPAPCSPRPRVGSSRSRRGAKATTSSPSSPTRGAG
jgi:hypothetical protein